MGICVCCAGLKGKAFLSELIARGLHVAKVISYRQDSDRSDSYEKIAGICEARSITLQTSMRPHVTDFADQDLIFMIGWQFLLPFGDPRLVVFHDSLLPKYRGFAPSVAALIAGERRIGVTALTPVGEIDAGPILGQAAFEINPPARIGEVLGRQAMLMVDVATDIIARLQSGQLIAEPQDHSAATYSVWRDADDYAIDWSLDAARIVRLVHAVGYPYSGALTSMDGEEVIIDDCEEVPDLVFVERQVGKVWCVEDGNPVVICGQGLLRITSMRRKSDAQPVKCRRLRVRFRS
jgi:methionyl-tRNA formyltransferase